MAWKLASADPETAPSTVVFVALVVNLIVFVPVSNLGLAASFGFGKLKQHFKLPRVSVTNLTLVTVAWAPLVCPTNFILFLTCPEKAPWTWVARLNVSTFKIVDDVEYTFETGASLSYTLTVLTFVGALYGPSRWFGAANLKVNPDDLTVSPVWNTPLIILISSNFGVTNAVTSTLSK